MSNKVTVDDARFQELKDKVVVLTGTWLDQPLIRRHRIAHRTCRRCKWHWRVNRPYFGQGWRQSRLRRLRYHGRPGFSQRLCRLDQPAGIRQDGCIEVR